MSTPTNISNELDEILDNVVYCGNGLDWYGSLSLEEIRQDRDYIEAKAALTHLIEQKEIEARIDEIHDLAVEGFNNGGFGSVANIQDYLESRVIGLKALQQSSKGVENGRIS